MSYEIFSSDISSFAAHSSYPIRIWEGEKLFADFEDCQEGFLRDIHFADPFHAALSFLLFFKKFAFAGNVTAVALGNDVLADRGNGFARDHASADGRLDGDFEHLTRNEFSHLLRQRLPAIVCE